METKKNKRNETKLKTLGEPNHREPKPTTNIGVETEPRTTKKSRKQSEIKGLTHNKSKTKPTEKEAETAKEYIFYLNRRIKVCKQQYCKSENKDSDKVDRTQTYEHSNHTEKH